MMLHSWTLLLSLKDIQSLAKSLLTYSKSGIVMQPLMEMGFDSLSVMELRNTIEAKFDMTLPATLSFDHPTASAIAQYIEGELCDASLTPLQDTWQRSPSVPERASIEDIQVALINMVRNMIGINIPLEQVSICAQ